MAQQHRLPKSLQYIENFWYAIYAVSHLKVDKPTRVKRFGVGLVVWKQANGNISVFEDRCPHRGSQLSAGKIVDNHLHCPYHGAQFNTEGKCVLMPCEGKNKDVPNAFRAKKFHVQLKSNLVWIWWGEGEPDQEIEMPWFEDFEKLQQQGRATFSFGEMTYNTSFLRYTESAVDNHHFMFVHPLYTPKECGPVAEPFHSKVEGYRITNWGFFRKYEDQGKPGDHGTPFTNCLRFPNIHTSEIPSLNFRAWVIACPIDERNTWLQISVFHSATRIPILRQLIAKLYIWWCLHLLLPADVKVMNTQEPLDWGYGSDMLYTKADRSIVEFWRMVNAHRAQQNVTTNVDSSSIAEEETPLVPVPVAAEEFSIAAPN